MQCLTDLGNGVFKITNPQPNDTTNCVYVIAAPSELQNQFNITMQEAQIFMPLLGLVLVMGFTYRAIARALNSDERHYYD